MHTYRFHPRAQSYDRRLESRYYTAFFGTPVLPDVKFASLERVEEAILNLNDIFSTNIMLKRSSGSVTIAASQRSAF